MPFYHLVLIALIQGITEFLPVSSSGHLILLPSLTKLGDQGALIDVAAHIGTLFAVIIYFWIDVKQVLKAVPKVLRGQFTSPAARLLIALTFATIPVICVGAILKVTGLSETMRSVSVIGWAMLILFCRSTHNVVPRVKNFDIASRNKVGAMASDCPDPWYFALRNYYNGCIMGWFYA